MGVPGVARGDDREDALAGQRVDQVVLGVVGRAEVGPEGHVDDVRLVREVPVHVGVQGTVQGVEDEVGGTLTAEDAQPDQLRLGRGARADPHLADLLLRQLGEIALVGLAVRAHAVARGGARHVRSVAAGLAVQRVVVRLRDAGGNLGVVGVAREVVPAEELLGVVQTRVLARQVVRGLGLLVGVDGARTTEVGVGVVDARVDDGDLDALTGLAGLGPGVEGVGVQHGTRVVAVGGDDLGDLDHVGALAQLTQLRGIALEGDSAKGVGCGVQQVGPGGGGQGGTHALHRLADGPHPRGGLDRVLAPGAHALGLRGLEGTRSLQLHEDRHLALGVLEVRADQPVGVLGVVVVRLGRRGDVDGARRQRRAQGQCQAQGGREAGLDGSATTSPCLVVHVSSFDIRGMS